MDVISIIIPVYNTGKYLKKCLDSVLNQTYKNIEVIIVDDGSTDDLTKEIYTEYENKYDNIKVVYQNNQGSAVARNTGIMYSTGKYIGFIDSDDFIEKNMYTELYNCLHKYNTKISFCEMVVENYNKNIPNLLQANVYSKIQALHFLFLGHWHSVCTALYNREIFDYCSFPVGETNEDYIFQFHAILSQEKVSYVNKVLYHYVKREDSNTGLLASRKNMDWIIHTSFILNYIEENSELVSLLNQARYQYLYSNVVLSNKIVLSNVKTKTSERNDMYAELSNNLKKQLKYILNNPYFSIQKKFMSIFISICPQAYMNILCFILKIKDNGE